MYNVYIYNIFHYNNIFNIYIYNIILNIAINILIYIYYNYI